MRKKMNAIPGNTEAGLKVGSNMEETWRPMEASLEFGSRLTASWQPCRGIFLWVAFLNGTCHSRGIVRHFEKPLGSNLDAIWKPLGSNLEAIRKPMAASWSLIGGQLAAALAGYLTADGAYR